VIHRGLRGYPGEHQTEIPDAKSQRKSKVESFNIQEFFGVWPLGFWCLRAGIGPARMDEVPCAIT
jgi:hypothetical protein